MIQVGDRIGFKRNGEMCEGYCTILAVDRQSRRVELSLLPEGIELGDEMVWIGKQIKGKIMTHLSDSEGSI